MPRQPYCLKHARYPVTAVPRRRSPRSGMGCTAGCKGIVYTYPTCELRKDEAARLTCKTGAAPRPRQPPGVCRQPLAGGRGSKIRASQAATYADGQKEQHGD